MFEGLFQPTHLLVIFAIALLVLGPKKLPELGKGVGESIRGFKSAMAANGSGLQWSTIRNIAMAWVLTLPIAMVLSGVLYFIFSHLF